MKKILSIEKQPRGHWVGDGFPVRTIISPRQGGPQVGPFIMMDYAGPYTFEPANQRRGVDTHPHRGFETVTVVFSGEVEHRDSSGNSGKIGPGDVQWMTAGSGVLHEEKHSAKFTAEGGNFEMAQLWVNLPAKDKGTSPGYQTILSDQIPVVELGSSAMKVKIIAGEVNGVQGSAKTHTPVSLWLVSIPAGASGTIPVPEGQSGGVYVRSGSISLGSETATEGEFVIFAESGLGIALESASGAELLVLAGQPINEPVAAYGPFVMNTTAEIEEAIRDYQSGRYGTLV